MISHADKNEHPVFYWLLLLLLALCAFQLFSIVMGEAEGAWTANTYNTTTDISSSDGRDEFVHTKDDQYAVGYVSSADELWIAHKPTTGGSWEYTMVDDTYTGYSVAGIKCSSNNTLVMFANRNEGGSDYCYVWVKWPGSDWDDWTGYKAYPTTAVAQDMAINNTDVVCLGLFHNGWTIYARTFNLTTLSFILTKLFISGSSSWISVEANQSGDFWVIYAVSAGTMYLRDFNQSIAAIAKTGYWNNADLVCLPNDRFGLVCGYYFGSLSRYVYWMYQASHGGGFVSIRISTWAGSVYPGYPKVTIRQGSTEIWILSHHSVDTDVYEWHAQWDAVEATWQASEDVVSSETYYSIGASNSPWPKESGISWCQPKTGQAMHMWYTGGGSPYSMQIWTQDITWTPDLTTAWPEITTTGLDEGTYDELYSFGMSKSGGTAPFEWSIVSGPGWLEIGLTTGILSGTPPGVGTFVVEIQLADVIPRTDTESFNLKINPAETPYTPPTEETISFEDLHLGDLWIVLACVSIVVGLSRIITRGARI